MTFGVRKRAVWSHALAAIGVAGAGAGGRPAAPAAAQGCSRSAVIDVNRIMTDSARGKAVLAGIEKLQSERAAQLKTLNEELTEMQKRFQEGRLSLAEDKLAELQGQIEEKDRAFKRAREDAERDVQKRRADEIEKIEGAVFPIINTRRQGGRLHPHLQQVPERPGVRRRHHRHHRRGDQAPRRSGTAGSVRPVT